MRAVSRGYLTLREKDVRPDPWTIALGGGPALPVNVVEDWSYYQSISVRLTIVTDVRSIVDKLTLDEDANLAVLITWTSTGTSLRGSSDPVPLELTETTVQLDLDGGLLRGDLKLEGQIVLIDAGSSLRSTLAPFEPGSILWTCDHVVQLEGVGARMPILSVPFSSYFASAGNHGLWWLQVTSLDMWAPADSALWMWLNDENPVIKELLSESDSETAAITRRFLKLDFYRQLVLLGLQNEDFSFEEPYPAGSLGSIVRTPLRLLGSDLTELRGKLRNDPQRFDAEVQSRLGGL